MFSQKKKDEAEELIKIGSKLRKLYYPKKSLLSGNRTKQTHTSI